MVQRVIVKKYLTLRRLILFCRQAKSQPMEKITADEKKVARLLQHDLPLVSHSFEKIGASCGLRADEVIKTAQSLRQKGYMRRFGAVLNHKEAGFVRNALVVWAVPPEQTEETGKIFSSFPFISHCYERKPPFQNKYNLFTMLHTRNDDIPRLVAQMAPAIKSCDFLILESIQEYKKISPEYF